MTRNEKRREFISFFSLPLSLPPPPLPLSLQLFLNNLTLGKTGIEP